MSDKRKRRLDVHLVETGLADTRSRAEALIMSGKVMVGGIPCTKAGTMVTTEAVITLKTPDHPWVSRGGLKLAHALKTFAIEVQGAVAVDVGSSTGGFTDVLLTNGATKIYAVDVGHGQLAWKLRQDERVVVLEKTNARYLDAGQVPDVPDMIVCDASFIGLRTVLPAAMTLARPGATLIALIKPQFEAGKADVGKGGVVRDAAVHERVCQTITDWLPTLGWTVHGLTESPITGPEGNREFLVWAEKGV